VDTSSESVAEGVERALAASELDELNAFITVDRDGALQPRWKPTSVQRLRAAGAVIVGKTNLTEFACGTTGRNQAAATRSTRRTRSATPVAPTLPAPVECWASPHRSTGC